jgi:hypothetical protein
MGISRRWWTVALVAALPGCATWGPTWSEITGMRYDRISSAGLNVAPVMIEQIDGSGAFPNLPDQPIKIEPGNHRVVVQAAPLSAGWTGGTQLVAFTFDAEPCKRYYVNAKYENPLGTQYTPFIGFVEPIAGCQLPAKQ